MTSLFGISTPPSSPVDLDVLGLPNPHPVTFKPFDVVYVDGRGKPTGDGYVAVTWHFDALTIDQLTTLLGYIGSAPGAPVRIRTRTDTGTGYPSSFVTYDGFMWRPVFGEEYDIEMGRYLYTDVTLKFSSLQGVS